MQTEKLMLRKFRVLILLAVAALAWNVTPAYSTTLTPVTSVTAFLAATSGDTTITFAGLTPPGMTTDYSAWPGLNGSTGLTDQNSQIDTNVQFVGITGNPNSPYSLDVADTSTYGWTGMANALEQAEYPSTSFYVRVNFATPVTAFGANLFTSNPNATPFTVTLYDSSSAQLGTPLTAATNSPPTPAFWGVTSDTPIYSVDFTLQGPSSQGSYAFLDNFTYGTADTGGPPPETPEAATMLLIGTGLVGLAILGKKMKPVQPV
jgi:hypothetical protein